MKQLSDKQVDLIIERHARGAEWSDADYESAKRLIRLAEAEFCKHNGIGEAQPAREWVGLTDEEIVKIANSPQPFDETAPGYVLPFAHAIESALREKNAGKPAADANAPWLTEAHMLCTDHGIPHGHIGERIKALRAKLGAEDKSVIDESALQRLTENGAKAWAGVDPQDLRDGKAVEPTRARVTNARPKKDTVNPCAVCGWAEHMAVHQPPESPYDHAYQATLGTKWNNAPCSQQHQRGEVK